MGTTAADISRQFAAARAAASPQALRKLMFSTARAQIEAVEESHRRLLGTALPKRQVVDGMEGKPIEQVERSIVIEWSILAFAARWVGRELMARSPVKSGRYKDAHSLIVDGEVVRFQRAALRDLSPAAEVAFVNLLPYARKIEKGLSPKAPSGVYEATAEAARARFKGLKIEYAYRTYAGDLPRWKTGPRNAAQRRFPTIVMRAR